VRDILNADDMVVLYYYIVENIDNLKGQAYNVGGGYHNSLSLLELFNYLEEKLDLVLKYEKTEPRYSDQKVFIADMTKIQSKINWKVKVSWQDGIDNVITWLNNNER
jgi:CDP-paratose 2-epimerase